MNFRLQNVDPNFVINCWIDLKKSRPIQEMQCTFENALSFPYPPDAHAIIEVTDSPVFTTRKVAAATSNCVEDACTAVLLSEYPHRICNASEAFSTILGFLPKQLDGKSLRMAYGPRTDVEKMKGILSGKSCSESQIFIYRRDGEELCCSARSHQVDEISGQTAIALTIERCPEGGAMPPARPPPTFEMEAKRCVAQFSSAVSFDSEPSLSIDSALLAHLRAIRRSRKHSTGSTAP